MTTTDATRVRAGPADSRIRIENLPNDAVVIRSLYPDDQRRKGMAVMAGVFLVLCAVPFVVWFMMRAGAARNFATIAAAFFVLSAVQVQARQFAANTCSYVFRADRTGLTLETTNWRGSTRRHFTVGQIEDIVLGFSFHRGPYSIFRCWLVIKSPLCRRIRCLHNAGGDHLARVANALRAALGMPAREWP